jgi:hypothetical protein
MRSALIATIPIDIGPGNRTVTTQLNAVDLSTCGAVVGELTLTTIATDAADHLDVKFQETRHVSQSFWDTRAYFYQVPGNQSASSTAPYADEFNVLSPGPLTAGERNLHPSGGAGATEIGPGMVRNGPFQGRLRAANGIVATHQLVVTLSGDVNANAHFVGLCKIFGVASGESE